MLARYWYMGDVRTLYPAVGNAGDVHTLYPVVGSAGDMHTLYPVVGSAGDVRSGPVPGGGIRILLILYPAVGSPILRGPATDHPVPGAGLI